MRECTSYKVELDNEWHWNKINYKKGKIFITSNQPIQVVIKVGKIDVFCIYVLGNEEYELMGDETDIGFYSLRVDSRVFISYESEDHRHKYEFNNALKNIIKE